jgi:hypothetical protein
MGFQASATSVTIRARLTKLGRQKLIENSNTVFSHFMLGDSDANYYTSEVLPTGTIPTNSGNIAFISGSTSDNIADGVGVNSKLYRTISPATLKPKQNGSSTLIPTLRLLGETTVSGDNVSYVAISKSATTSEFTNLFKSLSLPLSTANIYTFAQEVSSNGGWADTPFSGLGVSNVLLSVINSDQYGELIDGKSIKVTLPVYTGYTTGGTPTGATTYTLYSTFPKTSWPNTVLDYWYKDDGDTPVDLFGNRINVAYLVSDDIQKPNDDVTKSWSTGYDSYKPFSQGNKETINTIAVPSTGINSDRIAGIAYLDKGILAITDQTIVNNIATNFSGDSTTNTINDGLGLYYYSAGTYNTVIDSIQNDLVQDIVCIADKGEFYNTQNTTFNINDNVRISEIAITDGTQNNILAIGKTDRHIIKTKNEMIIFNVQIVI